MYHTALVFGLGKYLSHSLQHSQALVSDNELYTFKTSSVKPLREADPTGFVFFHTLSSAQNLTVAILIDSNRNQNSYIFVFSAPILFEVDAIHIHIRVLAALQRTVAPGFDIDIGFFYSDR